jgi:hypothetical protein
MSASSTWQPSSGREFYSTYIVVSQMKVVCERLIEASYLTE